MLNQQIALYNSNTNIEVRRRVLGLEFYTRTLVTYMFSSRSFNSLELSVYICVLYLSMRDIFSSLTNAEEPNSLSELLTVDGSESYPKLKATCGACV